MPTEWFFSKGGQQLGPVSSEQLKQLAASDQLQPSDLVWKDGMSQWIEARKITGLFPTRAIPNSQPLPLPFGGDEPPPLPATPRQWHYSKQNQSLLWFGGIAVVLLAIAGTAFLLWSETPEVAYQRIIKCGEAGNFENVWNRIDRKTQTRVEMSLKGLVALVAKDLSPDDPKVIEWKSLKGKDLFVRALKLNENIRQSFVHRTVKTCRTEGNRATLVVVAQMCSGGDTSEDTVYMLKEDGIWKLSAPIRSVVR